MKKRVHPRVVAATSTAAAASLVLGYAFHLPADVAAAIVSLATFGGGWAIRADG